MYKIYRKEVDRKICLCTQSFEDKEQFKTICKNTNNEIYLNDKNVSNEYRPKVKKEIIGDLNE